MASSWVPGSPLQAAKRLRRIQSAVYLEVSAWEANKRRQEQDAEGVSRLALLQEFHNAPATAGQRAERQRLTLAAMMEGDTVARSGVAFGERFERGLLEKNFRSKLRLVMGSVSGSIGDPLGCAPSSPLFMDSDSCTSADTSRPASVADGQSRKPQRRKSSVASAALRDLIEKTDAICGLERDTRSTVERSERATRQWLSQVVFFDPYYEYLLSPHERLDPPPSDAVWRRKMCIAFVEEHQARISIATEAFSFRLEKIHCRSPFTAPLVRENWRLAIDREYLNAHYAYMETQLGLEEFHERERLAEDFRVERERVQLQSIACIVLREPQARRDIEQRSRQLCCILLSLWHPTTTRIRQECSRHLLRRYFLRFSKREGVMKHGVSRCQRAVVKAHEAAQVRGLQTRYLRKWVLFGIRRRQISAVAVMERAAETNHLCESMTRWAFIQHRRMRRRNQLSSISRSLTMRARDLAKRYLSKWFNRSRDRLATVLRGRNDVAFMHIMMDRWRRSLKWIRRRRKYRQNVLKLSRRSGMWRQARSLVEWKKFMVLAAKIRAHYFEVQDMFSRCQNQLTQRYFAKFRFFHKRRHQWYASLRLLGRNNARCIIKTLQKWMFYEHSSTNNRRIGPIKDRSRRQLLVPYLRGWAKYSQRHKQAKVDKVWATIAAYTIVRFTVKWMKWRRRVQYRRRMMEANQFDFIIQRNEFRFALMRWTGWVKWFLEMKRIRLAVQAMQMRNEYGVHARRYFNGWQEALTPDAMNL